MRCFIILNIIFIFSYGCREEKSCNSQLSDLYILKNNFDEGSKMKNNMENTFYSDIIMKRRSIRKFKSIAIPEEILERIMNSGIFAPSAGNTQPWFFYIIYNQDIKNKLVKAALGQSFIADAPLVIVVCADIERTSGAYGERGVNMYMYQDTAACIENMLLVAQSEGIGSCWVGAFRENIVREILNIPLNLKPVAIVPFGYPDENPIPPQRKDWRTVSKIIE